MKEGPSPEPPCPEKLGSLPAPADRWTGAIFMVRCAPQVMGVAKGFVRLILLWCGEVPLHCERRRAVESWFRDPPATFSTHDPFGQNFWQLLYTGCRHTARPEGRFLESSLCDCTPIVWQGFVLSRTAPHGGMKGLLDYSEKPLVSAACHAEMRMHEQFCQVFHKNPRDTVTPNQGYLIPRDRQR